MQQRAVVIEQGVLAQSILRFRQLELGRKSNMYLCSVIFLQVCASNMNRFKYMRSENIATHSCQNVASPQISLIHCIQQCLRHHQPLHLTILNSFTKECVCWGHPSWDPIPSLWIGCLLENVSMMSILINIYKFIFLGASNTIQTGIGNNSIPAWVICSLFVYLFWVARAIFQLSGDCHHYRWPMLSTYGF
jgi:hypothetical protein